ncbi:MAG: acyl carrier protein [Prosthecobacter sp.]
MNEQVPAGGACSFTSAVRCRFFHFGICVTPQVANTLTSGTLAAKVMNLRSSTALAAMVMIGIAEAQTPAPSKPVPPQEAPSGPIKADQKIAERFKKIIVELLGVDPNQVVGKARYVQDFGADSLDVVEIVMAIEEEFKIAILDEDVEKLLTVEQTIKYIEKKLK